MDLSTIKRKLDTGQYQEPWQYVEDIWLMFNNAWLYNRKTSRVYKYCSKLAEVFETEIDPVMQSLGYCCGRKVRRHHRENQPKIVYYSVMNMLSKVVVCLKKKKNFMSFSFQFEFSPQTLCCYGKQLCTIQRDAAYFSYQNR